MRDTAQSAFITIVKLVKQHFTEKNAMSSIYKLEQTTIDLVKLNRRIVALSNDFDSYWKLNDKG
ncbi:MAG: hypothetical protein K2G69_06775 [Muribaculaceae bacterium]|nr:hypothetical protein [Muribaculaceae bacterium]